jgi:hypothetical protein
MSYVQPTHPRAATGGLTSHLTAVEVALLLAVIATLLVAGIVVAAS